MRGFGLRETPSEVLDGDTERFGDDVVGLVAQWSGLPLDYAAVRRYCHWFVGSDFGWKRQEGDFWAEGFGQTWQETLGRHFRTFPHGMPLPSLHMKCKVGRLKDRPFYWTRYVAIDLDNRPGQLSSIYDRYDDCVRALGQQPVVLSSPRSGLHLLVPLQVPLSVFGLVYTLTGSENTLISSMLREFDIVSRPGLAELFPTPRHTLRMPLSPGTGQLNPETLLPMPPTGRAEAIARLVESMDVHAAESPLDAVEAANRLMESYVAASSRNQATKSRTHGLPTRQPSTTGLQNHALDLDRLEHDGLYAGVGRNSAAMALARRKMLGEGWNTEDTVRFLMDWTATKTNGLSESAAMLGSRATSSEIHGEYQRICRGIDRAIERGTVVASIGGGRGKAITPREAEWVFATTQNEGGSDWQYRLEVFLCCLMGFAKDLGVPVSGPARRMGAALVTAQIPAATMQRWPWGSSGRYKLPLTWAQDVGFARVTLNYRNSRSAALCRARTYELEIELNGVATDFDATTVIQTAKRLFKPGRQRVHPRQIEHALWARSIYADTLDKKYGESNARRIQMFTGLYDQISGGVLDSRLDGEAA